ncbi:16S rRNA (cytosine(1402)-N(4))-methyltransferase RsmH [Rhodobacteraceae bacterium NNCM2]|nr:16S rRNA (cytosine(1402)-N(4))-methyltransferase RsmH [Coraliihabitans acroporae]
MTAPHIPVLLPGVVASLMPVGGGTFVDGTFGAGGYTSALLDAGAAMVIGIDRDPTAIEAGRVRVSSDRLVLVEGRFSELDDLARGVTEARIGGVVLDIGVSSMQLDQAERGFSFMRDGPLDMRMGGEGASARDLVNRADEKALADIIFHYGEDRASRRIARAIVKAREEEPIERTGRLAEIVASVLPHAKKGQVHPATRTFQALRIAVNDELGELVRALFAAERLLGAGGRLSVVTFHSLEDRIVKRFFQLASGTAGQGSRHMPASVGPEPRFERPAKPVVADEAEIAGNPRSRSARLRAAVRTAAPALGIDPAELGLPTRIVPAELLESCS